MRCCAADPAGEGTALPRPPGWVLGRGKEWETGGERVGKKAKGKKGKRKESKMEKGGEEMRRGRREGRKEGEKRERKEEKWEGEGRNFVQLRFFPRKNRETCHVFAG